MEIMWDSGEKKFVKINELLSTNFEDKKPDVTS
jgi:hypothetical protein